MKSALARNKNLTLNYSLVQFFHWLNFASVSSFASIYLLDVGFSNTQIGILIAVSGIISAFLQPVVASYADRLSSPSLKKITSFITAIALFLGISLYFCHSSLIFTGLFYGSCMALIQLLTPLVNALGMESMNQGHKLNYGAARGMGSLAYAAGAYVLGILVSKWGAGTISFSIIAGFGLLFAFLLLFPFQKMAKLNDSSQKNTSSPKHSSEGIASNSGALYFFKKYPRFTLILMGCILIYVSHVLINSFTFQIIQTKGGDSSQMGTAMALGSLFELPVMFLFAYMQKKIRCDIWFRISGLFFFLKILGSLLAPNMIVFYLIQIFQMGGWALITVSSVYYVNSIMEPEDAIKGQAYFTMTYTLGSVLGAFLGGALIDQAGVNAMLIFGTVAALIGALLLLFSAQKSRS